MIQKLLHNPFIQIFAFTIMLILFVAAVSA